MSSVPKGDSREDRPYALFALDKYYPAGGWHDFYGAFKSIDEAKGQLEFRSKKETNSSDFYDSGDCDIYDTRDIAHVVDLRTMQIVWRSPLVNPGEEMLVKNAERMLECYKVCIPLEEKKIMSQLDKSIAEHNRSVETMAGLLISMSSRMTKDEREVALEALQSLDMNCVLSDSTYQSIEKGLK